jgi:pyrroline-5-carboxylate reductase
MKLACIGSGIMGEAIISALLAQGLAAPNEVVACDILEARRRHLQSRYSVRVAETGSVAAKGADMVLLSVKPQEFPAASRNLNGQLKAAQIVLSIMAGVPIAHISQALQHSAVVRAIPNTPAQIGEGLTLWTATAEVSQESRELARRILAALGQEIYVTDEEYIDTATAVSSSGPAYIFLVMEALVDAAVHIGFRRETAELMVIQTVLGSARYAQASGRHLAELRNQVTSPGGTTTEGIRALEKAGLRAAFVEAVQAAYDKARQLGG